MAAAEGKPHAEKLAVGGGVNRADPTYESPLVGDVEILYIAFDVIMCDGSSVIDRPLEVRRLALHVCPSYLVGSISPCSCTLPKHMIVEGFKGFQV